MKISMANEFGRKGWGGGGEEASGEGGGRRKLKETAVRSSMCVGGLSLCSVYLHYIDTLGCSTPLSLNRFDSIRLRVYSFLIGTAPYTHTVKSIRV